MEPCYKGQLSADAALVVARTREYTTSILRAFYRAVDKTFAQQELFEDVYPSEATLLKNSLKEGLEQALGVRRAAKLLQSAETKTD